jgi:hypothetical protein
MMAFTLSAYPNDRIRLDTANLRFFSFMFDIGTMGFTPSGMA